MYIFKNAARNVWRAKGRNILMGIILFVITVAICIGFSIRQAAQNAKDSALSGMSVTATIGVDRSALMQQSSSSGEFDKSQFHSLQQQGLSVEELKVYQEAESVSDFYFTTSVSVNGSDSLEPVTEEASSSETDMSSGKGGRPGSQSDFTITGYSSDLAMTGFVDGSMVITEGSVFTENTEKAVCIISDELALYNNLKVGSKITVVNPNSEADTYTLTVKGIYNNSQSDSINTSSFSRGNSTSSDPANQIYTSYEALAAITEASAKACEGSEDDSVSALTLKASGTYVFNTVEDYQQFEGQARTLGLDEMYSVSSSDVSNFEASLLPLETLSTMVKYFLFVILGIGAVVLAVLNMFNTRARKYEIGVLTAIGMKKRKVAMQFITEILIVTVCAVIIGGIAGTVSSVPVANSLLASQVEAQENEQSDQTASFGRDYGYGKGTQTQTSQVTYVSQITSTVDVTILAKVLGINIILAVLAGGVSVMSIMRYDPLKILSGRD